MVPKKTNILSRFKRKSLELLTAGAVALSSIVGCDGGPTKPIPPPPTNQSPIAEFTAIQPSVYAPSMVTFNSTSRDPDGSIVKHFWDFGDGSKDSTSGPRVQHMYSQPGSLNACLSVEDNKGLRSPQSCKQIVRRDASPSINVSDFSFNEDEQYIIDLTGKVASPIYENSGLKVTGLSPNLEVLVSGNGSQASVKNKTKDWNGSTYIDFTVEDQDGRKVTKRTNVTENPQTDIKGYFKQALTRNRVSGVPMSFKGVSANSDSNGDYSFQVPAGNDTLRVLSPQYCKIIIPVNANGQDIDLSNTIDELIEKYVDPATPGESNCHFLKTYSEQGRWADEDLPIKVWGIYVNPPSQQYADSVATGVITKWNTEVKKWFPDGKKRDLLQLWSSDPARGIKVKFDDSGPYFNWGPTGESFKEGFMGFPNQAQALEGISKAAPHEGGNALLGTNRAQDPYQNHVIRSPSLVNTPALLEGNALANKYSTKAGYEKYLVGEQP